MSMMTKYYYADGSRSDKITSNYGVVCVVEVCAECGRKVHRGYDYYLLLDTGWLGVFHDGLLYYITHQLKRIEAVLVGAMVDDKTFKEIIQKAKTDPGLPVKSANHRQEAPTYRAGGIE